MKGSGAEAPLISVIVPTFHSEGVLEGALRSLADQSCRSFEVVLSDGASRDGTLHLARSWGALLPALTVLSRPDRGVYDAINLAIDAARGEWLLVLGSDDRLHASDTLAQVAPVLRGSTAAMVYGDVRMMAANGHGIPPGGRYAGPMPMAKLMRANICQQAIFYRRSLFDGGRRFDPRLPVLADWAFNLRTAFRYPMQWVDLVVADYAATGISARGTDSLSAAPIAELIRSELLQRRTDKALWPLQRILLRQADNFRRRQRWRDMLRHLASYLVLVCTRRPILRRAR